MPSSYQVVLWKQESFVVLRPLHIEFFRNLLGSFTSLQFRQVGVPDSQVGSKLHTAAKAETTGCARACHRAFDSQPRGRSRSAVGCPARRRCALATRFQQWCAQRPSIPIQLLSIRIEVTLMRKDFRPSLLYFLGCASDFSGFCAGIAACSLVGGTMFLIRM